MLKKKHAYSFGLPDPPDVTWTEMKLSKGHDSGGWQLAWLSLIQDKCPVKGHDPEIWKREICVSLRKVPVGFTLQNQLRWLLPFFAWLWRTTYCSAITSYNSFEASTTEWISLLCVFLFRPKHRCSPVSGYVRESRPTPNSDICHVWSKVVWKCYQWSYFFHCPLFCVTVLGWLLALIC